MKLLYKFDWSVYRMGDIQGVFSGDPDKVADLIGEQVYFGEVLGKHSEIYGTLEEKDLTVVSSNQDFISEFDRIFPRGIGYNPLDYITQYCEDCGGELDPDFPCDCIASPY